MRQGVKVLTGAVCLWFSVNALAANPYEITVPLQTRSMAEQETAVREALGQVLSSLSGGTVHASSSHIPNPEQYIQSFKVDALPQNDRSDKGPCCSMTVLFNDYAVQQWLQKKSVGAWHDKKPNVMLFLVRRTDTSGGNYEWLSASEQSQITDWVREWSLARGLPTQVQGKKSILGMNWVSPKWIGKGEGANLDSLWQYSKTPPDILALGYFYQDDEGVWVRVRWHGRNDSFHDQSLGRGATLQEALMQAYDQGIHQLDQRMAKTDDGVLTDATPAVAMNASTLARALNHEIELDLTHIEGSAQYDQALRYLKLIAGVQDVKVLAFLPPDRVRLNVQMSGGEVLDFLREAQKEKRFVLGEGSAPDNDFSRDSRYVLQWRG